MNGQCSLNVKKVKSLPSKSPITHLKSLKKCLQMNIK